MINVTRREGFTLRIERILREPNEHSLDIYLYVPGELGLNKHVVSEENFYHNGIHSRRTYFSTKHELPLVHSRLAGKGRMPTAQYRLSLSLYAYQYASALEKAVRAFRNAPDEMTLEHAEREVALIQSILRRLRRNAPDEDELRKYYNNIDNYLSWFTEQQLLSLVAHLPRNSEYASIKSHVLAVCAEESRYRRGCRYNSERAEDSPTRMSNKMRLLRRLIEYPVTLSDKPKELGGGEQRFVKALATGLVMIVVTLVLVQARYRVGDFTIWFIMILSVVYALREVFKDELRNTIWRWLRKGRPKWRRHYRDPESKQMVGRQREWFDYKKPSKVDKAIQAARGGRSVSHRQEVVLHYRSRSRMLPTRFLSGYNQTRETITLDLGVLSKLMNKDSHHVYQVKDGQVSREKVERRYQLNLVVRSTQGNRAGDVQRWKIVVNRSRIVDIEEVHIPARKGRS